MYNPLLISRTSAQTAASLLAENPQPTDKQILDSMAGNVCRCGCYQRITYAVRLASLGG